MVQIFSKINVSGINLNFPLFLAFNPGYAFNIIFSLYYYGIIVIAIIFLTGLLNVAIETEKKKQIEVLFIAGSLTFILWLLHSLINFLFSLQLFNIDNVYAIFITIGTLFVSLKIYQISGANFTAEENILDSMPDCLILCDMNGHIKNINAPSRKFLQYSYTEVLNKDIKFLFSNDAINKVIVGKLKSKNIENQEGIILPKDMKKKPVLFSSMVMKNINNNPFGIICIFHDITDRKKTEEILLSTQKDIEQKMIERTDDFIEANIDLREKIEELELENIKLNKVRQNDEEKKKQILITIKNACQKIIDRLNTSLSLLHEIIPEINVDQKNENKIYTLKNETELSVETISNVYYYSQFHHRSDELKFEKIDINKLIKDIYDEFKLLRLKSDIEFICSIDDSQKIYLYADKSMLNQIISNLLNISFHFTNRGRIEFGYDYSTINEHLVFFIKDMREEFYNKISEDEEEYLGILINKLLISSPSQGINFEIAKELILKHNGKIWIKPDAGYRFNLNFSIPFLK
ncbi:MAG: PAS domain-containing sensor histidine kinase [Bacteroidales bacterium]|nr:PAS domain-containing sensor histidine kinase [Bacteroidales bacterium]